MGAVGALDSPREGHILHGPVAPLTGWLRYDLGYDRVEVRVGPGSVQRARILSKPRPDIAGISSDPCAPLAGWDLWADVPKVGSARTVRLFVEAVLYAIAPGCRGAIFRRASTLSRWAKSGVWEKFLQLSADADNEYAMASLEVKLAAVRQFETVVDSAAAQEDLEEEEEND